MSTINFASRQYLPFTVLFLLVVSGDRAICLSLQPDLTDPQNQVLSNQAAQAQIQVPTTPVQLPPLPDTGSFLTPIGWAVLLKVILNSLFQDKK